MEKVKYTHWKNDLFRIKNTYYSPIGLTVEN